VVRDYYPNTSTNIICYVTGFNVQQVYRIAAAFNVKKTPEYKAELLKAEALKLQESGLAHRFKKGHAPLNKGKKMSKEAYEKVKPTMFKPGSIPHNTKHDGHISIRMDKTGRSYSHIRVAKGTYKLLHRVIWERHNGAIPKGFIVAFKNGNTMDCTLENLELISRQEGMLRNSMMNKYPADVVEVIRLKGALKRRIKKLEERW
jgi:hypothetical protein